MTDALLPIPDNLKDLDRLEKHLLELAEKGKDVSLDLMRITNMRCALAEAGVELKAT